MFAKRLRLCEILIKIMQDAEFIMYNYGSVIPHFLFYFVNKNFIQKWSFIHSSIFISANNFAYRNGVIPKLLLNISINKNNPYNLFFLRYPQQIHRFSKVLMRLRAFLSDILRRLCA